MLGALSLMEFRAYLKMCHQQAIKELVLTVGLNGIYNYHLNELNEQGHSYMNMQNAISYFTFSPATAKYRMGG